MASGFGHSAWLQRALGTRALMTVLQGPNQRWSLDFVTDAFSDGRFRILTVIEDFTRECLASLVADTSLSGEARVSQVRWPRC